MHDLRRVVLWMAGTLMSFSALAVAIREMARVLTVWEVLALRNLGGIALLAAYALVAGARIGPPTPLRIHLVRNLFHFFGQACWAFGVTLLPLATVFALEFTTPAWTMVMATIFLGERISRARIGALVLGFLGVLVILRPGAAAFNPAALIVLAAALFFSVQITTTKFLTGRNSTLTILFWMNILQLPAYLATNVALGGELWFFPRIPADAWLPLLALLVTGLSAHVCFTNAMRYGDATLVVPIDFLRIPFIATIGVLLYAEPFDPMVLLGAAISAAGILWSLAEARRYAQTRRTSSGATT
ncbi:MAG: DMT family transporter [Acetobacteraceae bacterium]|nr:DMT family transporter [Acetobacteraceae bacterium]